jgi:hypothetical protein
MKPLNEWMDAHGISPEQAAEIFGKSIGTIRNWRSGGVPSNQREWVEKRMVEWTGAPLPEIPDRLVLEIPRDQFDEWSRAALAEGKILREWAIEVLDEAATLDQTGYGDTPNPVYPPLKKVAEDPVEYKTRSADSAKPGQSSLSGPDAEAASS